MGQLPNLTSREIEQRHEHEEEYISYLGELPPEEMIEKEEKM